jgi:hypothetical protein
MADHDDEAEDRALISGMQKNSGKGDIERTDPSVKIGPRDQYLPPAWGEVKMATTMRKPQAYRKTTGSVGDKR